MDTQTEDSIREYNQSANEAGKTPLDLIDLELMSQCVEEPVHKIADILRLLITTGLDTSISQHVNKEI